MKLDEFDQYIRDQYQGYEVTPPPRIEAEVMGRLTRLRWGQRLGGAAILFAAATLWWVVPMGVTEAEYAPVEAVRSTPSERVVAETAESVEPIEVSMDNLSDAPQSISASNEEETWHSAPKPDRLEPLTN